ncbi:hypothetical protein, partial [Acinetobacter baumannii]|uniref:hypothetical protein n=1 Tax=Acinetobacter baumannii TaxID=470 RepID=UPI00312CBB9E
MRIVQGAWEKSATGEWEFDENPSTEAETVLITPNDPFEGLGGDDSYQARSWSSHSCGVGTPYSLHSK